MCPNPVRQIGIQQVFYHQSGRLLPKLLICGIDWPVNTVRYVSPFTLLSKWHWSQHMSIPRRAPDPNLLRCWLFGRIHQMRIVWQPVSSLVAESFSSKFMYSDLMVPRYCIKYLVFIVLEYSVTESER